MLRPGGRAYVRNVRREAHLNVSVSERLEALCESLGLTALTQKADATGWTAKLQLTGCWPIPTKEVSFGKCSSCVIGEEIPVSCSEVELTLRARRRSWVGGWVNTYGEDLRIPSAWRGAIIPPTQARQLLAREFDPAGLPAAGFPDLVLARDGMTVLLECERERGRYRAGDCSWKVGAIGSELPRSIGARPPSRRGWSPKPFSRCGGTALRSQSARGGGPIATSVSGLCDPPGPPHGSTFPALYGRSPHRQVHQRQTPMKVIESCHEGGGATAGVESRGRRSAGPSIQGLRRLPPRAPLLLARR